MSNSFRIRTEPGVDKSLNVLIDQEFEYLEILSLKILQSQIYTRQCSDYGVLVGRVSVNNGFGIPNAKVSIFVPLDSTDELDPVISELYPYKSLSDLGIEYYPNGTQEVSDITNKENITKRQDAKDKNKKL
jgi:hypothetical protein